MRILVTGGTGTLGRDTLPALTAAGYKLRAISRRDRASSGQVEWLRADMATGEGLQLAVEGIDAVVHLASVPYRRGYTRRVDIDGTRQLVRAAQNAGVGHLVYASIVGIDQIPWGYFRTKQAAEQIVKGAHQGTAYGSGPGWTILRATQFHSFIDAALVRASRLPVLPVDPGFLVQTVDTRDVADRIARLVAAGPTDETLELGGPEVLTADEAIRQWLAAAGRSRRLLPVRLPGRLARAFRAGHATTRQRPTGQITWSEYLTKRYQR
jgi:uncharacterized protein YbjT (DUF2867 family)